MATIEYPEQTIVRLTVYLPLGIAEAVKASANDRGQTISEWVKRAALADLEIKT